MSSNIAHSTYYVVKPYAQTARVFASLAQAATAIIRLDPTPVDVSAIIGIRRRGLTVAELCEVREICSAHGVQPKLKLHPRSIRSSLPGPAAQGRQPAPSALPRPVARRLSQHV